MATSGRSRFFLILVVLATAMHFRLAMLRAETIDPFNYPPGTALGTAPAGDAHWLRRGDKNTFVVTSGVAKMESSHEQAVVGAWWKQKPRASDQFQRISVEFATNAWPASAGSEYTGALALALDQNVSQSGFYLNENGYVLTIRGRTDMWIARTTKQDGWGDAVPRQACHATFPAPLEPKTTYRVTFTKDGAELVGVIETLDGTILGRVSYTEAVPGLAGGNAGIIARGGVDYVLDNAAYHAGAIADRAPAAPIPAAVPNTIKPVLAYDPDAKTHRPFFPVGWYVFGVAPPVTIEEIARSGANTVLFAGVWDKDDWHFPVAKSSLNKARELGVKIVLAFHQEMLQGVSLDKPESYEHLRRWVEGFRDHPALLGWQLGDENGGPLTAPMVSAAAHAIKRWDPHHQIWQVFEKGRTEAETVEYMEGTDVYSLDYYQYHDGRPIFGGADILADVYLVRALWAHKYGWAGAVNVTQAIGADTEHLSEFRFPNEKEYRWNVFNAIASARARGTLNWVYYYGPNYYSDVLHFTHFRDDIVQPVTREQLKLAHAMETGWNVGKTTSNHDERVPARSYSKVSHILLHDDVANVYYLIATNNTNEAVRAQIALEQLPVELAEPAATIEKEGKVVPITARQGGGHELAADLEPFEVNIYTIPSKPKK